MSNRKLLKGIVIGAAVGGLFALLDRDTRNDVLHKLKSTSSTTNYYVKHPAKAVHSVREGYDRLSDNLSNGVGGILHVLTQLQETLDSINDVGEDNKKSNDNDLIEM